jgi:NAD(P)-dependent dehydrogenase (short-subunit alcohol dehydrogenase family)
LDRLDDGRVLITGCSSGVGRAAALRLSQAGYGVVGTVRSADDGRDLEAADGSGRLSSIVLDLTDDGAVASGIEAALAEGPIDALVNNAGIPCLGAMEELDLDDLRAAMDVNLYGAIRAYKAVASAMRRRGRGIVVNVSSSIGAAALALYGGYCATKFALEAVSEAMRLELEPYGVRVHVLRPGLIATPFRAKKLDQSRVRFPHGSPYADRLDNPSPPDLAELVSTADEVAAAIQAIIEDPGAPFRVACGRDSRRWLEARRRLDDDAFLAAVRDGGYAF